MKTKIIFSSLLCLLGSIGINSYAQAKDSSPQSHSSQNTAQKYQQVCKGKTQGADVSFAYKGVIWNGHCQSQFFPTRVSAVKGDEKELNSICVTDPKATSIQIEGKTVKGKCALGFSPPQPR